MYKCAIIISNKSHLRPILIFRQCILQSNSDYYCYLFLFDINEYVCNLIAHKNKPHIFLFIFLSFYYNELYKNNDYYRNVRISIYITSSERMITKY